MSEQYTFKGGIKDGSPVPDMFWIMDVIEIQQNLPDGNSVIYYYELNDNDRCWHLVATHSEDGDSEQEYKL